MLNYDAVVTRRADEIMTGDIVNTHCGIGDYAWKTVTRTRLIERPAPLADRVELTLDTDAMCKSREVAEQTEFEVIPAPVSDHVFAPRGRSLRDCDLCNADRLVHTEFV